MTRAFEDSHDLVPAIRDLVLSAYTIAAVDADTVTQADAIDAAKFRERCLQDVNDAQWALKEASQPEFDAAFQWLAQLAVEALSELRDAVGPQAVTQLVNRHRTAAVPLVDGLPH